MIRKYKITNFGPYKLDGELNFVARKIKEDKKHILLKNTILPVIAIYGPNGGGKSKILESFVVLQQLIHNKIDFNWIKDISYIGSKDNTIDFYVEFQEGDNIYKYELSVNPEEITNEKYTISKINSKKENCIFDYKNNVYKKELFPDKIKFIFIKKNKKCTLLNYLNSLFDYNELKILWNFFKNIFFAEQCDWTTNKIAAHTNTFFQTNWLIIDKEKEKVLKILNDLSINIIDIICDFSIDKTLPKVTIIKEDLNGERQKIDYVFESSGTKKLLNIISLLLIGLKNNTIFVIDELDSGLHTMLLKYIIKIFKDKKINYGSQLIFSSHDTGTLNKENFRRDEIYFAALNESKFSDIISLADLLTEDNAKIRTFNNYAKKYLDGDFGYDPYIDLSLKGFKNE